MEFAITGMRPHLYPHLLLSTDKVAGMVRHFVDNTRDTWNLCAFDGARPVAVVAALVQPLLWHERCEAHVLMCRSEVPGVGARLIRAMMDWASNDPRIRQISFAQEPDADPRQLGMLKRRFGFQRSQQVGLWAKE